MTSELCTLIIERKPEFDALDLARNEAVGDVACAGAAEFLRQRHPEQARFAHQPEQLRVGLFLEVGLLDAGRELLGGEIARRVADHPLVFGELALEQERIVPLEGAEIRSVKGAHCNPLGALAPASDLYWPGTASRRRGAGRSAIIRRRRPAYAPTSQRQDDAIKPLINTFFTCLMLSS